MNAASDLAKVFNDGHYDAIVYGVNKNNVNQWYVGEMAEYYNKGFQQGMADALVLDGSRVAQAEA